MSPCDNLVLLVPRNNTLYDQSLNNKINITNYSDNNDTNISNTNNSNINNKVSYSNENLNNYLHELLFNNKNNKKNFLNETNSSFITTTSAFTKKNKNNNNNNNKMFYCGQSNEDSRNKILFNLLVNTDAKNKNHNDKSHKIETNEVNEALTNHSHLKNGTKSLFSPLPTFPGELNYGKGDDNRLDGAGGKVGKMSTPMKTLQILLTDHSINNSNDKNIANGFSDIYKQNHRSNSSSLSSSPHHTPYTFSTNDVTEMEVDAPIIRKSLSVPLSFKTENDHKTGHASVNEIGLKNPMKKRHLSNSNPLITEGVSEEVKKLKNHHDIFNATILGGNIQNGCRKSLLRSILCNEDKVDGKSSIIEDILSNKNNQEVQPKASSSSFSTSSSSSLSQLLQGNNKAPKTTGRVKLLETSSNSILLYLNKVVNFALSLPNFNRLSSKDQKLLLISATPKLLLIHLAAENFQIQTQPEIEHTSNIKKEKNSFLEGREEKEGASEEFVEGIKRFIKRCHNINVNRTEFFYLKLIALYRYSGGFSHPHHHTLHYHHHPHLYLYHHHLLSSSSSSPSSSSSFHFDLSLKLFYPL